MAHIIHAARRIGLEGILRAYGSVADYGERVWGLSPDMAQALEDYFDGEDDP